MASQYVGIDLHRRRSVIVRQTPDGEVVDTVRIDNDPVALSCAIAEAGPDPEVVIETQRRRRAGWAALSTSTWRMRSTATISAMPIRGTNTR